jgi:hypothetical protein
MDDQHVLALVEAIDGTHLYAVHVFTFDTLASARDRLPESRHFVECGVIFGAVVRARSVHKACYGHNRDWAAAQPLLA